MTQFRPPEDDRVEAAFAEARKAPPAVPDALMARIMADALNVMPQKTKASPWRQLFRTLGGWPAMAGLAATTCVGLWMGGTLGDDLLLAASSLESAALDTGLGLGGFDLLLVDG